VGGGWVGARGAGERGAAAAHFARTGRGRARPWRAMTRHRRDILDPGARSRRREIRRVGRGAELLGLSRFLTGDNRRRADRDATRPLLSTVKRIEASERYLSTRLKNERNTSLFLFSLCFYLNWNSQLSNHRYLRVARRNRGSDCAKH